MDPAAPRQQGFDSLDLTLNEIKKIETDKGMLKLKLAQQDVYLPPIYLPPLHRLGVHRRATLPTPTPGCLCDIRDSKIPNWGPRA